MRNSIKALMLSGLIFPGVGYFSLKQSKKAVAVIMLSVAAVAVMFNFIWNLALPIVEKIQQGAAPADPDKLSAMVRQALIDSDSTTFNVAIVVLVLAWLVSAVDGYITGYKIDSRDD